MNAMVVYDSKFGNTERVARAIAEALGSAPVVPLAEATDDTLRGVDLLVVGGPTQAHRESPQMREWRDRGLDLRGVRAAAFDTRFHKPRWLTGSAAHAIAETLRRWHASVVAPPESFFVAGGEGPLEDGELERAAAWARTLLEATEPTARG